MKPTPHRLWRLEHHDHLDYLSQPRRQLLTNRVGVIPGHLADVRELQLEQLEVLCVRERLLERLPRTQVRDVQGAGIPCVREVEAQPAELRGHVRQEACVRGLAGHGHAEVLQLCARAEARDCAR